MQVIPVPNKEELKKEIQQICNSLDKITSEISKTTTNKIGDTLWQFRADLEMLIIKFKMILEKEDKTERWQKTFLENLQGTGIKTKATSILNETVMNSKDALALFEKKPVESYKYFWKLKETISSIISAFTYKNSRNSSLEIDVEDADVFEI